MRQSVGELPGPLISVTTLASKKKMSHFFKIYIEHLYQNNQVYIFIKKNCELFKTICPNVPFELNYANGTKQ